MRVKIRSADKSDVYRDIARIPEEHRKDVNGNPIPSGKICKLTVRRKSKYVILRGNGDEPNPSLFLDEYCREKLGVRPGDEVDVAIRCATWWLPRWCDGFHWAWDATDPSYRLPIKISVVLGLLGVALGIISLLKS